MGGRARPRRPSLHDALARTQIAVMAGSRLGEREHVRITVRDAQASDRLLRALEPLVRGV